MQYHNQGTSCGEFQDFFVYIDCRKDGSTLQSQPTWSKFSLRKYIEAEDLDSKEMENKHNI